MLLLWVQTDAGVQRYVCQAMCFWVFTRAWVESFAELWEFERSADSCKTQR